MWTDRQGTSKVYPQPYYIRIYTLTGWYLMHHVSSQRTIQAPQRRLSAPQKYTRGWQTFFFCICVLDVYEPIWRSVHFLLSVLPPSGTIIKLGGKRR